MARTEAERRAHYMKQPNNKPRVNAQQVLVSPRERHCIFYAVIIDPSTQKRISEVEIWRGQPDEVVELCLERFTISEDGFVP